MYERPLLGTQERNRMPLLRPTNEGPIDAHLVHSNTATHTPVRRYGPYGMAVPNVVTPLNVRALDHRFAVGFDGGRKNKQGLWVREADGSYTYHVWGYDDAVKNGYADEDIFVVGRDGYYLTLAEARQAIPDGVKGVHYVDDYNDEFQDFFVCKADGIDPEPYEKAQSPEPIQ